MAPAVPLKRSRTPGTLSGSHCRSFAWSCVDDGRAPTRAFADPPSPQKELAWDAENRLIKVEPVGNGIFVNDTKCEFKYDYQGRRFEKKVSAWVSGAWAHSYTQRFVWGSSPAGNGWLMLMVVDGGVTLSPSAAERKFTWGRDLSGHGGGSSGSASCGGGLGPVGCLTGAGGIGGLLSVYDNALAGTGATKYEFMFYYDANGNVGQVIDYTQTTAAAAMVAKYGYDAYGNVNSKSGTYADTNTFRFSTKFWDTETNLGYWGYRYYDAGLGRWTSRDPIEEFGGYNLYTIVTNDLTDRYDLLGAVPGDTDGGATSGTCSTAIGRAYSQAKQAIDALKNIPCPSLQSAIGNALNAVDAVEDLLEVCTTASDINLTGLRSALSAAQTAAEIRCGIRKPPAKQNPGPNTPTNNKDGKCEKKPKRCKPCTPAVGTIGYRVDKPPSPPHYPYTGTHTHYYKMSQSPPVAGCKCFWVKSGMADGDVPVGVPMVNAGGGGVE